MIAHLPKTRKPTTRTIAPETTKIHCTTMLMVITVATLIVIVCVEKTVHSDDEIIELKRDCDRNLCDLIVTRCTLTDRCNCNIKQDARCVRDCINCLEEKFGKCCACVGLCPDKLGDSHSSHVGEISNTDQQLFETLTEADDIHGRWSVVSSTTGLQVSHPELGQIELAHRRHNDNNLSVISYDPDLEKLKCTVAFINKHLSMTKCRLFCTSMGASVYRWFHNGCCECVGRNCVRYGIDKPECLILEDDNYSNAASIRR